jgi:hypothetical protein
MNRPPLTALPSRTTSRALDSVYVPPLLCVLFSLVAGVVSCDSVEEKPEVMDLDQGIQIFEPSLDAEVDFTPPTDPNGDGIQLFTKEFGELCESNNECTSSHCISLGDNGVCTMSCLGDNCPEGWGCRGVSNTGADLLFLCVPVDQRLCRACASDNDCPAGRCLTIDNQAVCGSDCETDNDCIAEYRCKEVESLNIKQCVPQTDSCTCAPSKDGSSRFCENANDFGACYGSQVCDGELGWSTCDAQVPTQEICNLIDDNCNGFTDDVPMIGEVCSRETQSDTDEVITCTGRLICTSEAEAPLCTAPEPMDEVCNFLDDDCDGDTDEDFPDFGDICTVGQGLCQRYGVYECSEDGSGTECSVSAGESVAEICDGLDNDCDGVIDNGYVAVGQVCEIGLGLCRRVGTKRCSESGDVVLCDVEAALPEAEVCDGLDNDCDGVIDNGFEGLNEICTAGVGYCQRSAFHQCSADGLSVECGIDYDEIAQAAQPELCDGVDNDCDGKSDEAYSALFSACSIGEGACLRRGLFICASDELDITCSVTAGEPSDEICDGIDNNCDTVIDDPWPNLGALCSVGQGLCERAGFRVCPDDGVGDTQCNAEVVEGAAQDQCDFQDDDCDGLIDENFTTLEGEYGLITACGSCGNNCLSLWGDDPAHFGVTPLCEANAESYRCGYECLEGFFDADGRASNGCELSEDPQAIYVSSPESGGVISGDCGSIERPCARINLGLIRATSFGKPRVLVSEGVYQEIVELLPGIALLGGHNRINWVRDPDLYLTQIDTRSLPMTETNGYGVKAVSISSPTTLDGFTIYSASPLFEGNSYGIYIRDSFNALTISNNRVISGDGGRGLGGSGGASGGIGLIGREGLNGRSVNSPSSCESNASSIYQFPGGSPLDQTCQGVATTGGGGGGAVCPIFLTPAATGDRGAGPYSGEGGLGATHFLSGTPGVCSVSSGNSSVETRTDASSGLPGSRGEDGAGGDINPNIIGRFQGEHWSSHHGENGDSGTSGGGGGGGGASAGVVISWLTNTYDFGASGGSGGNGGCAGSEGQGGGGGGGSFGIFIYYLNSSTVDENDLPTILDNNISRGLGGNGGSGGNGGGGGEGGRGGNGGLGGGDDSELSHCSLQAGAGGPGGRGGHGGAGAGGQGGISYDIFIGRGPDNLPASYVIDNHFILDEGLPTFGLGGEGGNSSNTEIGLGRSGLDGLSGRIGSL